MDDQPNSREPSGSQWSKDEIERLKELAPKSPRERELRALFPGRTLGAIKVKLSHTRRELGLPKRGNTSNLRPMTDSAPTMLDPNDEGIFAPTWQQRMRPGFERANAAFLAALQQAA